MLYNFLLAAEDAGAGTDNKNGWIMWVIIAVVIVLMVVLTVIPQKKRQKEQQKMMSSLAVGTKLMTVGGLVGRITQVNTDNTLIVNVGTELNPTLIVIDKKAVGYVLENVAAPAPVAEAPAVAPETPALTTEETPAPVEEVAPLEEVAPVEEAAPAEEADEVKFDDEKSDMPEEKSELSDLDKPF